MYDSATGMHWKILENFAHTIYQHFYIPTNSVRDFVGVKSLGFVSKILGLEGKFISHLGGFQTHNLPV